MTTTTGIQALGKGCHYDTITRMTAMVTTMQDRLQERFPIMRPTTSLEYVIRQTDRLQELRLKLFRFFSHGSRAGTTTREDVTTVEVETAACNGNDYNNCDVSTTATSTNGSDTESTTSADTDLQPTPTFTAVDNNVDLINPLPDNCTHYISMIGCGKAPPPAPPAAVAGGLPGPGLMLPQARLPQPTVFDGTTPPFQEWMQETRNFLSINNYEFVRQMDYSLQSDTEVILQDVTNSTRVGGQRREALDVNEAEQDDLNREQATPEGERPPGRGNATVERELEALRTAHDDLQREYDEWLDRVERGGDYLNYILINGTEQNLVQKPTTTFGDCKEAPMV